MLLKTGFGILTKNGKKLKKFELTPGEHHDPIGYTFYEVANRAELDEIILDKSDEQIAHENKISLHKSLIASGKDKIKKVVPGLSDAELTALFGV